MFVYFERLISEALAGDVLSIFTLIALVGLCHFFGVLIRWALQAFSHFCGYYPLHVFEQEYRDCRATWLKGGGIMLTSRATGRTVSEIQFPDVRTVLLQRGGLGGRICLRFTYRVNEAQN